MGDQLNFSFKIKINKIKNRSNKGKEFSVLYILEGRVIDPSDKIIIIIQNEIN